MNKCSYYAKVFILIGWLGLAYFVVTTLTGCASFRLQHIEEATANLEYRLEALELRATKIEVKRCIRRAKRDLFHNREPDLSCLGGLLDE